MFFIVQEWFDVLVFFIFVNFYYLSYVGNCINFPPIKGNKFWFTFYVFGGNKVDFLDNFKGKKVSDTERAILKVVEDKGEKTYVGPLAVLEALSRLTQVVGPPERIGKGAVVGAGSVVTRDIPDNAIACGSPAKIIKMRGELSVDGR